MATNRGHVFEITVDIDKSVHTATISSVIFVLIYFFSFSFNFPVISLVLASF